MTTQSGQKRDKNKLSDIKKRLAEATPGPWETRQEGFVVVSGAGDTLLEVAPCDSYDAEFCRAADATFIAHAPTDIAALIAEVEFLRKATMTRDHIVAEQSEDLIIERARNTRLRSLLERARSLIRMQREGDENVTWCDKADAWLREIEGGE